jgi:hypothetical protein
MLDIKALVSVTGLTDYPIRITRNESVVSGTFEMVSLYTL